MLEREGLVQDAVGADELDGQTWRNVELHPQQLFHVTDARAHRAPDELGLERRKLIALKHIPRQTARSTVTTATIIHTSLKCQTARVQTPGYIPKKPGGFFG